MANSSVNVALYLGKWETILLKVANGKAAGFREMILWWVTIGLAIALCLTSLPFPAQARSCHQVAQHQICLDQVKRSAKYHWRYRVKAVVDGKPQPLTRYNCRDRTRTPLAGIQKGITTKFASSSVGDTVCKLVDR